MRLTIKFCSESQYLSGWSRNARCNNLVKATLMIVMSISSKRGVNMADRLSHRYQSRENFTSQAMEYARTLYCNRHRIGSLLRKFVYWITPSFTICLTVSLVVLMISFDIS